MIDGSEKRNCWWRFQFQIPHVDERRSNYKFLMKREGQMVAYP